jgi:DnaJ-class molecular chaperone
MKEIKVPVTIYETKYKTKDGKEFENREDAILHEGKLKGLIKCCPHCNGERIIKYTTDYYFKPGTYEASCICPKCGGRGYLELKWQ